MFRIARQYEFLEGRGGRQIVSKEDMGMPAFEALAQEAAECVRLDECAQSIFARLGDIARVYPSEAKLTASIDNLLTTDRLAGQVAVRACRTTFSVAPYNADTSLVLMAIPCVVARWNTDAGRAVNPEIQGWIRSRWLGFEHASVKVTVSHQPIPVEALDDVLGRTQIAWAHDLANEGRAPAAWPTKSAAPFTPGVWMVAMQVPSSMVDSLQIRLQQTDALDLETSTFKHRIEALANEQGAIASVLPPTSWANAFSVARAAAFRYQASAISRSVGPGTTLPVHYDGNKLFSYTPSGKVLSWGVFPEETRTDLAAMLDRAEDATGLNLPLSGIQ